MWDLIKFFLGIMAWLTIFALFSRSGGCINRLEHGSGLQSEIDRIWYGIDGGVHSNP